MSDITVSALAVFPVKGCRGVALQSAVVTPTGVQRVALIARRMQGRVWGRRQGGALPPPPPPPLELPPRTRRLPLPPPAGLLWDRNWVIVKESGGRFLTQRQVPK